MNSQKLLRFAVILALWLSTIGLALLGLHLAATHDRSFLSFFPKGDRSYFGLSSSLVVNAAWYGAIVSAIMATYQSKRAQLKASYYFALAATTILLSWAFRLFFVIAAILGVFILSALGLSGAH